ncbi:MAG TPA: cytochrome c-type biogenesis protein CcmH [Conexibacter sp.]|jgi:cytochrome c-type biogenesis protein CcmH/NrfF
MRRLRTLIATLLPLLLLAAAGPVALASAQGQGSSTPTPKANQYEMEQQLMCVTCRIPLSVAESPQAQREKDLVKRFIAEGKSEQQIKDLMVDNYGKEVLGLPRDDGFNIAVYLIPVLIVIFLLGVAAFFLPRWRRHARALAGAQPTALGPELSGDDARRLDEDLERYD